MAGLISRGTVFISRPGQSLSPHGILNHLCTQCKHRLVNRRVFWRIRTPYKPGGLSDNSRFLWLFPFKRMPSDKVRNFKIEGLCSAPCTPLTPDGEVNLDITLEYVRHFVSFGVPNAFVTGTTGEGNSLTLAERKAVAEAWVRHGKDKLSAVIIHIGTGNIKDSQELARHAETIGADAIACVGPTYHKPQTLEQYVYYMRDVAAAAPDTPFYLYDIDFVTGITFDVNEFFKLGRNHIPTLKGVKHTSPNMVSMSNCLSDHKGHYQILMGTDEVYLEGLALGLEVTIMNSYLGNVLNRVKQAFEAGDMATARLEQQRAISVNNLRRKYEFSIPGGTKAILRTLGMGVGDPRSPLSPIPQETVDKLKADLKNIGFFEWGVNK